MSLRLQAKSDLSAILSDTTGFAWLITVTDPDGNSTPAGFTGFSNDISLVIDPDTGTAVSGRTASIALDLTALTLAGFGMPVAISNETCKPWVVVFNDIEGVEYTFKIAQTIPDRSLGLVVCILEAYFT